MSLVTGSAADAFVPSDEELRIRESVAGIANRYGREYMRRCSEEERAADRAVGRAGRSTASSG